MNVEIKFDAKRAIAEIKRIQQKMPQVAKKALLATAQFGIQVIQDRTEKGFGYEGRFKQYSPGYAKAKAAGWPASNGSSKNYRRAFGGDPSRIVNLNLTGEMLGSMASKSIGNDKAEIYFTRAPENKKAAFNQKTRPFVGFNESEKRRLGQFFYKQIEKAKIK